MKIEVKNTLEFNKVTMALSSGGFAYSVEKLSALEGFWGNSFATATILSFVASVLAGVLVIGRASKLNTQPDGMTDDPDLKKMGAISAWSFLVGAALLSTFLILKVWEMV
ncbi:MAG: hypothetical protein AAF393_12430 [Pseudomonadota bacterium]